MKKKLLLEGLVCVALVIAIIAVIIGNKDKIGREPESYDDGIERIDLDSIYLKGSDVQVDFSDVIVVSEKESRKLIVFEQETTVTTQLTDRLIKKLDVDWGKKTQDVSYTGKGYFVVDLDKLTKDDIVEDKKKKVITIKIDHSYLQAIEIDPDKIMIDDVKEGLFAKGDIKLTVADYNGIEKELKGKLETQFINAQNAQKADDMALKMVKEVYEPVIKAIDSRYDVHVEFKTDASANP